MRNEIGALTLFVLLCASGAVAQQNVQLKPLILRDGTPATRRPVAPLTNAHIVAMVKSGKPTTEIIVAIRTHPTNFYLSVEMLLALHRQGVSTQILNAMTIAEMRQGKVGGSKADELSPQPYPPRSRVSAAGETNADELSPQPYPPKATLLTPGGQQTMLGGQAKPLLADGNKSAQPTAVERSALTAASPGDGSMRTSSSPAVQRPIQQVGAPNIGVSQTMGAMGNTGNSRTVAAPTTSVPAGLAKNGTGTLVLSGGSNPGLSMDNPGNLQLSNGSNSSLTMTNGGTLALNGATNQGSKGVAPPPPATNPSATPTSIPSKGHQRNEYEAITAQRGVTHDSNFGNWANSTGTPAGSSINTSGGALTLASPTTTPAGPSLNTSGALTMTAGNNRAGSRAIASPQTIKPVAPPSDKAVAASVAQYQPPSGTPAGVIGAQMRNSVGLSRALARAACAKDPTPRILGVVNVGEPITFQKGHRYTILGCAFGPANPNNAVYLSDGSSFTFFLHIFPTEWRGGSVLVSVPSISGLPQLTNLMLFVLGQNGNTKLNGVDLSAQ